MYGYPYGAPAYGYVQPVMQPMMPAFGTAVSTYVSVPTTYSRMGYNYPGVYNRYSPFVVPFGLPPHITMKMMEASQIFRTFDSNFSGGLDKHEFYRAMWALGYYMSDHQAKNLFYMIDTNGSGRIDEREFCEYWISTHPW